MPRYPRTPRPSRYVDRAGRTERGPLAALPSRAGRRGAACRARLRAAPLLVCALLVLTAGGLASAADYADRFEAAWDLVNTRYWNIARTGVDWAAVGEEYRPRAVAAADDQEFYATLEEMYAELGDDHSVFVPPAKVAQVRAEYGDLPCIMLFTGPLAPRPGLATTSSLSALLGQRVPVDLRATGREANVTYGLTPEGVGYVRLPDLASTGTAAAVRSAVARVQDEGAWAIVLDLRGNPGGRLLTMMQVAGVFTRGLLWRTVTTWALPLPYPAIGLPETDLPLAVLVDDGVNSAAEGLAGALQARGRATVVGERSAGNVEALLPFCLRDGSQAWVAAGVLAPIGGPTWEGRGVAPDVETDPDDALPVAIATLRQLEDAK